jgi:DDE superfamily endonuclease
MTLGPTEEMFNIALSKPRTSSEHTIGMLKGRFPWLRNIRMAITEDKNSLKTILKYIDCCVILHNLLIKQKDPVLKEWMSDNDHEDPLDLYPELKNPVSLYAKKDTRRQQLTMYIRENFIYKTKVKAASNTGKSQKKQRNKK